MKTSSPPRVDPHQRDRAVPALGEPKRSTSAGSKLSRRSPRVVGSLAFLVFLATIPAANWLIGNVGTYCVPDGPCLIPVGFGLIAPSGVLMIGLALVLRDAVHRLLGWRQALVAIFIGTVLSYSFAPPSLVLASSAAFLLAELLNQAVYAPLHRRRLIAAVLLSSLAGTVADSALFLWLAFGSLDYLAGQVIGKAWMVAAAALFLALFRKQLKTGVHQGRVSG